MSAAGRQDDQRLSAKSPRAAACSVEAVAWTNSSIVLRTLPAVAMLARTSFRDRGGRLPKANWPYRRVPAENLVRNGQAAACRYSWRTAPNRSCRSIVSRVIAAGSVIGWGSGHSGRALARPWWGRCRL